ncbi:hypothetical protein BC835DRAFT_281916 [Cytidiella melzeri]|nr:hypothetical protein BC835DRAFT_281916 [Cytidiella melzeri]
MAEGAPIYTLPDELLAEILRRACGHPFPRCRLLYRKDDPERNYFVSPLVIIKVSRRLRHVAQLSPELWTCIHVIPCAGLFKLAEIFLSNSQSLPISLTLSNMPRLKPSDAIWDMLKANVNRWEDAAFYDIDIQEPFTASLRDTLAHSPLPMLRSLILETRGSILRDVDFSLSAPNLRRIRMTRMMLSPESYDTTCQNLTRLSLGGVALESWHELVPLLWTCKQTLQALLLGPDLHFRNQEDPVAVQLPQLRYLSFTQVTRAARDAVLQNVVAPSLNDFVIGTEGLRDVLANMERRGVLLKSVRRLKIIFDYPTLLARPPLPMGFLHTLPAVEQLFLDSHVIRTVLSAAWHNPDVHPANLTPDGTTKPVLRELVIEQPKVYPGLASWDPHLLLDFITQSKARDHPPLHVYVADPSALGDNLGFIQRLGSTVQELDAARWQGSYVGEDLEDRAMIMATIQNIADGPSDEWLERNHL